VYVYVYMHAKKWESLFTYIQILLYFYLVEYIIHVTVGRIFIIPYMYLLATRLWLMYWKLCGKKLRMQAEADRKGAAERRCSRCISRALHRGWKRAAEQRALNSTRTSPLRMALLWETTIAQPGSREWKIGRAQKGTNVVTLILINRHCSPQVDLKPSE